MGESAAAQTARAETPTAEADTTVPGVAVMTPKVAHRSLYGLTTTDVRMSIQALGPG